MRTAACLSRLRCDQLLNGELDALDGDLAHAASCARCTALLDAHRRERASFGVPLRRRRRWPAAVVVAAMAAVAAVVWLPRVAPTTRPTTPPGTQIKGVPVLGFYVKRGEAIHRGATGELVAAGDLLDFTVASPAPAFVAVISVDGAHQVTTYYPAGPLATAVAPGEQLLPLAVRLDGVLGVERLYGVFCDRPAPVAELSAAIARGATPAGCVADSLVIEKR